MLTIRLQRVGKPKQASYRFVVSERARDPQGKSLELLGQYQPLVNPAVVQLKTDRIKYWLAHGAQTSATVHNLLVVQGIISGKKRKAVRISKTRQEKLTAKKNAAVPAPATAATT